MFVFGFRFVRIGWDCRNQGLKSCGSAEHGIKQLVLVLYFHHRATCGQERSSRLTDAYIENLIDRQEFEKKKTALTLERREIESQLTELKNGSWPGRERWEKIVELMKTAYSLYKSDSFDENREIMKEVMSNSVASGKSLVFTVRFPFIELTKYDDCRFGGLYPR